MKTLFKTILILWTITGFHQSAFSQSVEADPVAKEAISKLDFVIGSWKGEGWMMGSDRMKHDFTQTEDIQFKLDSTAILIEGRGMAEGKVVHNAMAIITYAGEENQYAFQSYLQNGRKGEFKAELIEDKFYWYPMENMRYIIEINKEGKWFEIGEIKQGESWYRFFEMTLDK